ncbi:hypothetical protein BOX15_Mlig023753g2, partial [Macrostomum lignano]
EADDNNVDFDTQLRLEREEAAAKDAANGVSNQRTNDNEANKKTRTDEDGTVFDWDEDKQAWFPRIDSEMLIRYQLGYGTSEQQQQQPIGGPEFDSLPPEEQEKAREYWEQYYNSQEYRDWYARYSDSATTAATAGQDGESSTASQQQQQQSRKRELKKKKPDQQQQQWFEVPPDQNTHVFVQNLPLDLTEPEFIEFMSKCGMVLHDPLTRRPKVKLYTDEDGNFNGSARCGYIKKESVALALQILDGYRLRDCEVSVEPAKFQPKEGFDPSKRRKLTNKEKKKVKEQQTRLLAWAPADSAASADGGLGVSAGANAARRSDRVLVISNVFDPSEFDSDPLLLEKIRDDVVTRCAQYGPVRKAVVHDRNPDGVVLVTFAESGQCSLALSQLDGRMFRAGRVLKAAIWDGRTKYHVEETEEQAARRRAIWERQILGEDCRQTGLPTTERPLEGQPEGHPESQPEGHPKGQPEGHPEGHPKGQPEGHPEGHPKGQPEGQPEAHPGGHPGGQPEGQPEVEAESTTDEEEPIASSSDDDN